MLQAAALPVDDQESRVVPFFRGALGHEAFGEIVVEECCGKGHVKKEIFVE